MTPDSNTSMVISLDLLDIAKLSFGVFIAMLAALIIAKKM